MSNQIPITPIITFYEYEKCYFAIHGIIAQFFKVYWGKPEITINDLNFVNKFLKRSNFDTNVKQTLAI